MIRPLPHDTGLIEWEGLSEEQRSMFTEGCQLFDEGSFWHAHESWEELWKSLKHTSSKIEVDAVQGIIQSAALLYNYDRNKVRGVVNMASKLMVKLRGVEHGIWGVDIAALRTELIPFIADAAEAEPEWSQTTGEVSLQGGWIRS